MSNAIDSALQRELDRGEFAGTGTTIEGEIVGTGEWEPGAPLELEVRVPLPADGPPTAAPATPGGDCLHFTESMLVPAPDEPLTVVTFGRLLAAHGYSRSQAKHLEGDPVQCSYTSDGWEIVVPPPASDGESTAVTQSDSPPESSTAVDETATGQLVSEGRKQRYHHHKAGHALLSAILLFGGLKLGLLLGGPVIVAVLQLVTPVIYLGGLLLTLSGCVHSVVVFASDS